MKFGVFAFFIILSLVFTQLGKCQCLSINLIKNPNLEEYNTCPTNMTFIAYANNWYQPLNNSTSDYFNVCGIDSVLGEPSLLSLFQQTYFGNGYAGIRTYVNSQTILREYIQGTLSTSLIANKCYYCEFWVKLYNNINSSTYPLSAIDALGIFFSDTLPKSNSVYNPFYFDAQINNPSEHVISDTNNWTRVKGTFNANGNEKYLTVGTFKQENDINKIYFGTPHTNYSYYFFDNFSLCPCEDTIPPKEPDPVIYVPNIFSPNNDAQNDILFVRGQQIESLHFLIYNRWGNLVFESNDKNEGWDGKQAGKPCETGVYVYRAEVVFKNGLIIEKRGNVTLVR